MANGIKLLRISKDLRQDDLAALTGIGQQRLSNIEKGHGRPITPKELVKIQSALGENAQTIQEKTQ